MEIAGMYAGSGIDGHHQWTLTTKLGSYLSEVEGLYGRRDATFTLLGVAFADNGPYTWFSSSDASHVVIVLSTGVAGYMPGALFELAHEVVHLLAPVQPPAIQFEEGLAAHFSMIKVLSGEAKGNLSAGYQTCCDIVSQILNLSPDFVTKARKKRPSFSKWDPNFMKSVDPELPDDLLVQACAPYTQ